MAEREVVIKISAKNLTEAEFKKVKKGLTGVGESATGAAKKTVTLKEGFSDFRRVAGPALGIVTAAAAATAGAIVVLTAAVIKLGQRGTELVGIKDSFVRLTAATGQSGEAMVAMTRTATKGLITDLKIMEAANKGLLLGLPITDTSMGELASTAIILGKAMGQDAAKSLDDLITGLGRASPLILDNLGITVKVGEANEVYAAKLGKTVKQLTDAEKKTAFYEATLEAARSKVQELGGIQLTFGDLVQRGVTSVTNLTDSLAIMIAQSPALLAGMQSAGDAIAKAFGSDQKALMRGIVDIIEEAAFVSLEFGKAGVTAAIGVSQAFGVIKSVLLTTRLGFSTLNTTIAEMTAKTLEVAAVMSDYDPVLSRAALAARAAAEAGADHILSLKGQIVDSVAAAEGTDTFGLSLQTLRTGLEETQFAIVTATESQRENSVATGEVTDKVTAMGTAIVTADLRIQSLGAVMVDWQGKLVETSEGVSLWRDIVSQSFAETTTGVEGFGIGVAGVGDLVGLQTQSMSAAFASFGLQTKAQMAAVVKKLEADFKKIAASGLATDKQLEESAKKLAEARQLLSEETTTFTLDQGASLVAGAAGQFAELGGKFKAFAIAEAIISTFASVAKTWAQWGWPIGIPFAAAALAAGFATVAKIKAQSFQEGTENLDFQDFGTGTQAFLHRREAVIPQSGVGDFAAQIAKELDGSGGMNFDFRGATFSGTPEDNAAAIRKVMKDSLRNSGEMRTIVGRASTRG